MTTTWVLFVIVWSNHAPYDASVIHSVHGFKSKAACEAAAAEVRGMGDSKSVNTKCLWVSNG